MRLVTTKPKDSTLVVSLDERETSVMVLIDGCCVVTLNNDGTAQGKNVLGKDKLTWSWD